MIDTGTVNRVLTKRCRDVLSVQVPDLIRNSARSVTFAVGTRRSVGLGWSIVYSVQAVHVGTSQECEDGQRKWNGEGVQSEHLALSRSQQEVIGSILIRKAILVES